MRTVGREVRWALIDIGYAHVALQWNVHPNAFHMAVSAVAYSPFTCRQRPALLPAICSSCQLQRVGDHSSQHNLQTTRSVLVSAIRQALTNSHSRLVRAPRPHADVRLHHVRVNKE